MASNLTQATRDLVDRTWRSAVSYGSPLLTRLIERKRVWLGGTAFTQMYETSDTQSLVQEYGPNDGLNGGTKEFIAKPSWMVAYSQCPLEENVDERIMNAPKTDAQLLALAKKNTQRGMTGLKMQLAHRIYGCATDTELDAAHTYVQGIPSALFEGNTYGGISRSLGTASTWQSAGYATWDTAAAINKTNLDTWLDFCMEYATDRGEYLIIMGDTLYNRLKGIFEASNTYMGKATKASQGFESMEYNSVEIAKDYLLDRMTYTGSTNNQGSVAINHNGTKYQEASSGTTCIAASTTAGLMGVNATTDTSITIGAGSTWVFVLDLRTWNLHYTFSDSSERAGDSIFGITDYFDQSKIVGGAEKWVARAKFKGNVTCDMPNRNLMRANVS